MNNYDWEHVFPDLPDRFHNRVNTTLINLENKEEITVMKNKNFFKNGIFKKSVVITLMMTLLLGGTAIASGKIFSTSGSSSNIPTYKEMPTTEQVKKDFGFDAKLVEDFDNQYQFDGGYLTNYENFDEEGNSLGKAKSLSLDYTQDDHKICLSIEKDQIQDRNANEKLADNHNGTDIYYCSYANKLVPADYLLTEQDKKDEASGKYIFSYGSDKVEISQVQSVLWVENGVSYNLLVMDSPLTEADLVAMAHQVIDTK
ncbi:MAG: hypothetical protein RR396_04100 [Clostridiales bacterium]